LSEPTLAVETRGLWKSFGSRVAVEGLSIQVECGEIYGFLGENGAGKTTTFRVLLGLIWSDEGEAYLNGQNVVPGGKAHLEGVGSMTDSPSFYPHLTARENLRLFAELSGHVTNPQIEEALELVGLLDRADERAGALSHGQRQRLGVAEALLPESRLLLLDEPQNGLDPYWVKRFRKMLRELANRGVTILISSHRLHEIELVCDRVGIIHEGCLLYEGSMDPLLNSAETVTVVCDHSEEASVQLKKEGFAVEDEGDGRLRVRADAEEEAARMNKLLVSNGFSVSELARRRVTLEDVFLQLTKKEEEKDKC